MAAKANVVTSEGSKTNVPSSGYSSLERQKEAAKVARSALSAQRDAQRLKHKAFETKDPEERQRLANEALQKDIEAESSGKTASYLGSGAFQGLAAGAGIGTGTGLGLGTLTGTLIGGTTSLVTGGLGAALGSGVGLLHGPFVDKYLQSGTLQGLIAGTGTGVGTGVGVGTLMGSVVGGTTSLAAGGLGGGVGAGVGVMHGPFVKTEGLATAAAGKVTGRVPGWDATNQQKAAVEEMTGQVHEQARPSEADLTTMSRGCRPMGG